MIVIRLSNISFSGRRTDREFNTRITNNKNNRSRNGRISYSIKWRIRTCKWKNDFHWKDFEWFVLDSRSISRNMWWTSTNTKNASWFQTSDQIIWHLPIKSCFVFQICSQLNQQLDRYTRKYDLKIEFIQVEKIVFDWKCFSRIDFD